MPPPTPKPGAAPTAAAVLAAEVARASDDEATLAAEVAYFAHRDHLVRGIVITSFGAS
jgi:hypothetical protein